MITSSIDSFTKNEETSQESYVPCMFWDVRCSNLFSEHSKLRSYLPKNYSIHQSTSTARFVVQTPIILPVRGGGVNFIVVGRADLSVLPAFKPGKTILDTF